MIPLLYLIILLLIGIIVYLLIERHRLLLKLNKVEQQLLLSQINPHFIFNSLTAIQSFIFQKDPLQAGKYLSSFAKLIRLVLESTKYESIVLEHEVKALRLYFDLQRLRFEDKFDYYIEIDESLDLDEIAIPPMLAQPFIENSIEHGFIQLSKKGIITVRFIKSEKSIIIEVEDNGIGVEKSKLIHLESGVNYQALATEITLQRIKKIRQSKRLKIDMDIIDLQNDSILKQGSIVRFKIPVKN